MTAVVKYIGHTIVESEITDQELIDAMEKATDLWIKDRYFEGLDVLKRYENHNPHNCRYWVKLGRTLWDGIYSNRRKG